MKISELEVRSFRNLNHVKFAPGPGVNFILGKNAQGKTALLEAIDLLSGLRSFRGAKNSELVRFGSLESQVKLRVDAGEGWNHELGVTFKKDTPDADRALRRFTVNGKSLSSASDFFRGRFETARTGFRTIVFCPADHDLLRGEPELRRAFIDRAVASQSLAAFEASRRFARALDQRNEILKQTFRRPVQAAEIEPFTAELLHAGAQVVLGRLSWLQDLSELLTDSMRKLAPQTQDLYPEYFSTFLNGSDKLNSIHFSRQYPLPSLDEIVQSYSSRLKLTQSAEREAGLTLVGPHREDWTLNLEGNSLRRFGSQGEVRSALLALRWCEIELYRRATGLEPILLLDDFSSELDQERRSQLLTSLRETSVQVFVTATDEDLGLDQRLGQLGQRFRVTGGDVKALD